MISSIAAEEVAFVRGEWLHMDVRSGAGWLSGDEEKRHGIT